MPRRAVRMARRAVIKKAGGGGALAAPAFTSAPLIFGAAVVGATLTSTQGVFTGNPTPTATYQWRRDGVDISGATASTYTLVEADEGATITLRVTATNSQGNANSTSDGIGPVEPEGTATLEPFDVTLTNTHNSATLPAGPAVFGHTFAKGEVPAGSGLTATINAVGQEPQVDWISTYSDGSLKQASIVVDRPALIAGATATCSIAPGTPTDEPEVDVSAMLAGMSITLDITDMTTWDTYDATVTTTPADIIGLDIKALLLAAIASPSSDATNPTYWLRGHKCTQLRVRYSGGSLAATSMMVWIDASFFDNGDVLIDLQGYNSRLFETGSTSGKGRLDATWTLKINGVTRFTQTMEQLHRVAWRKEVWNSDSATARWPAAQNPDGSLATLLVKIDPRRWAKSGAVMPLDTGIVPDGNWLSGYQDNQNSPTWMKPLWHNGAGGETMNHYQGSRDMGTSSGGPWPYQDSLGIPANCWLLGNDIVYQRQALGEADGMFAAQHFVWDTNRDHWLDRSFHKRIQIHREGNTANGPDDPNVFGINTAYNTWPNPSEVDGQANPYIAPDYTRHFLPKGGPGANYNYQNNGNFTANGGFQFFHAISHTPRPSYFAYLATAKRAWYDQQMAHASAQLLKIDYTNNGYNPEYPNNYETWIYPDPRTMTREVEAWNEVRGTAWGLYLSDNARFIAKPGSHYDTYWDGVIHRQFDGLEKQRANMLAFYGTGPDAVQGYPFSRIMQSSDTKRHGMYHLVYQFNALIHTCMRLEASDPKRAWAVNQLDLTCRFWEGYFENTSGFDWRYILLSAYYHGRYNGIGTGEGSDNGTIFTPFKTWAGRKFAMDNWVADAASVGNMNEVPMHWDLIPTHVPEGNPDTRKHMVGEPNYEAHAAELTGTIGLLHRVWGAWFGDSARANKYLGYYRQIMALTDNVASNALTKSGVSGGGWNSGYQSKMQYLFTLSDLGEDPAFNEHNTRSQKTIPIPSSGPILTAPPSIATVPEGTAPGYVVGTFGYSNNHTGLAGIGVFAPTVTSQTVANAFKLRHDGKLVTDTGFANVNYATHGAGGISVTCRVSNDFGNSNTVTITVPIADTKPMVAAKTFSLAEHAPTADPAQPLTVGQVIGSLDITSPVEVTGMEITTQTPAGAMDIGAVSGTAPTFTAPLRVLDPSKFNADTDLGGTNPVTASVRGQNANGWGQATLQTVNLINISEPGDPVPMLLDALSIPDSSVLAAGGLTKRFVNYNGPLVRVYRSSDGTSLDVGAASGSKYLDWPALTAFVGANRGSVEFYDQKTGQRMAPALGTASRRPWITNADGTMITIPGTSGGRPAVQFVHTQLHQLRLGGFAVGTTSLHGIIAVSHIDSWDGRLFSMVNTANNYSTEGGANSTHFYRHAEGKYGFQRGATFAWINGEPSKTVPFIISTSFRSTDPDGALRMNGVQVASTNDSEGAFPASMDLAIGGVAHSGGELDVVHASFRMTDFAVLTMTDATDIATIEAGYRDDIGFSF